MLLTALGVAMLAAASQLGVAFGLGVVRLSRTFQVDQENQWTAQMAWVSWFAMVAAVAGAVAADRMARRNGYEGGIGSRIAYSVTAGVGAAVLVPLCMQPARFAIVRSTDPVLVIGLSAALGAVAGVFVALAALTHQPLLWNVGATTGAAWALALVSVIPSLGLDDPLPNLRLGVLDLASFSTGAAQSSAVVTMPLLALLLGAAIAGLGRYLGRPPVTIAASGLIGPAMLCLAYLVAGPGSDTDKFQAAPYWGTLVAVGAGTLGSVLATVVRRPTPRPEGPTAEDAATAATAEQPTVARPTSEPRIEPVFRDPPTEWSVPLPRQSADPDRTPSPPASPTSASPVEETTASLPAVDPPTGRGFFTTPEPAPVRDRPGPGGGLFDEPTSDLAPQTPPAPPTPPRPRPSRRPASTRPASGRDPGAAGAVTAFSAGRRAAGYTTGELPVYSDDDPTGLGGRPAGVPAAPADDQPTGRKSRKRGKEKPPADEPTEEAAPRQRRGLFGRRRAAEPPEEPTATASKLDVPTQRGGQPRPEPPLKPRDEEYVDWVSGLSTRDQDPRDR